MSTVATNAAKPTANLRETRWRRPSRLKEVGNDFIVLLEMSNVGGNDCGNSGGRIAPGVQNSPAYTCFNVQRPSCPPLSSANLDRSRSPSPGSPHRSDAHGPRSRIAANIAGDAADRVLPYRNQRNRQAQGWCESIDSVRLEPPRLPQ